MNQELKIQQIHEHNRSHYKIYMYTYDSHDYYQTNMYVFVTNLKKSTYTRLYTHALKEHMHTGNIPFAKKIIITIIK